MQHNGCRNLAIINDMEERRSLECKVTAGKCQDRDIFIRFIPAHQSGHLPLVISPWMVPCHVSEIRTGAWILGVASQPDNLWSRPEPLEAGLETAET